ncbi:hypothetical protein MKX03_020633 [Papaver bracteatum]|nr:hypothetical protein MKX03_020633 [Papaver bracteatum]
MGKPSITILIDQDPWLTIHSFCIWHITAKFSGWFLLVLRGQYFEWCSDFYKLYRFIVIFFSSKMYNEQCKFQVDLAIETIKNKETHDSMLEKHHFPISKIMSPLEEQVRKILTPYAYNMFSEELERASQYGVYRISGSEYMLKYFEEGKNTKRRRVFWDGQVIICSCKQFEFCGIVCRHILHVFIHTGCFKIPIT